MTLRKGDFVVNKLRDMEYRVKSIHKDGTVTLQGWFPLNKDGSRKLGCFCGDLTIARIDTRALDLLAERQR